MNFSLYLYTIIKGFYWDFDQPMTCFATSSRIWKTWATSWQRPKQSYFWCSTVENIPDVLNCFKTLITLLSPKIEWKTIPMGMGNIPWDSARADPQQEERGCWKLEVGKRVGRELTGSCRDDTHADMGRLVHPSSSTPVTLSPFHIHTSLLWESLLLEGELVLFPTLYRLVIAT